MIDNRKYCTYPSWLYRLFLFTLKYGDDVSSTLIIKDAREKLQHAILFCEYTGNMRCIPTSIKCDFSFGKLTFESESVDVTDCVYKFLKPQTKIDKTGISITFNPPE